MQQRSYQNLISRDGLVLLVFSLTTGVIGLLIGLQIGQIDTLNNARTDLLQPATTSKPTSSAAPTQILNLGEVSLEYDTNLWTIKSQTSTPSPQVNNALNQKVVFGNGDAELATSLQMLRRGDIESDKSLEATVCGGNFTVLTPGKLKGGANSRYINGLIRVEKDDTYYYGQEYIQIDKDMCVYIIPGVYSTKILLENPNPNVLNPNDIIYSLSFSVTGFDSASIQQADEIVQSVQFNY